MIKRITPVQIGQRFRVELTASGKPALTQARLALAALMPGLGMRDSAMNAIDVLPVTLYYNGGEEWRGLDAKALNARLKSAAPSFVKEVRSRLRTVEMVLSYKPSESHVTDLLVRYLFELPEVKDVSVKEATVTLKVALLTNLQEFEEKLRQHMCFSIQ